ncbi:GrpB family protein [Pseudomonas fulva]|uniref:GrpB family protein n=1 Tax=Pseudomonas fulva TaxID=47880 RepID=UPI0018AAAEC3|nr:GrpB family protein [Pseudomonas fulva]MBF8777900.1 GrpB family protein [Pseudomonas fulva]
MALTSNIMPYDSAWPVRFRADKLSIASAFGEELIAIHHVGSTAVPGLAAKPEIDVLIEVHNHNSASARDGVLVDLGYIRGTDLSSDHHFYRRDVHGVRTHKLHVCRQGHISIAQMLGFRDLLRQETSLRQQYQALKLQLEASNVNGMAEYLEMKAPFIIQALLKAGVVAPK